MPNIQKVASAYKATNRFVKENETRHFVDRYDDKKNAGSSESNRNDSKKSFEDILKDKISKTGLR